MDMNIRRINKADAKNYFNFFALELRKSFNLSDDIYNFYINKWNLDFIKTNHDNFKFIVSEVESNIVGILMGSPEEGGVATIFWILVKESHSQRGIGKSLFKTSCNYFKYHYIGTSQISLS